MGRVLATITLVLALSACAFAPALPTEAPPPVETHLTTPLSTSTPFVETQEATSLPTPTPPVKTQTVTSTATPFPPVPSPTPFPPSATPTPLIPNFTHIIMIVLENREFGSVIGNDEMGYFNELAREYTLLTQYYAIRHPSLPNYLAMIAGDTLGVDSDCEDCFQNAPILPDQIEASGRTWKTYQEDMPHACFVGSRLNYAQKHNPFIYFDSIRLNADRCERGVVPYSELDADLAAGKLPDFIFITPNMCNDAHDCPLNIADIWLGKQVPYLMAYPGFQKGGLIVLTWEEGQGDHGCCGFDPGGGRVATVLISPKAKNGFEDPTPYTHFSLLKTIETAWGLEYLGHAADDQTRLITKPWK